MDNENFKIKDSYGVKYEIPISRPDLLQVKISFKYIIVYEYLLFEIGKAYAASWITWQGLQGVWPSTESSRVKILHRDDF